MENPTESESSARLGDESNIVGSQAPDIDEERQVPSDVVIPYLLARVAEFRKLTELRRKGWHNPEVDRFFQKQRQAADNADEKTARYFYTMMKRIANEIHAATGALTVQGVSEHVQILDMCMAPGGFLDTALGYNPDAHAFAFSLPPSQGGHKSFMQESSNVKLKLLDITMLAEDMGVTSIPAEHPDANNFLPKQMPDQMYDLVMCDGQVLRTHDRAAYRQTREARRLATTQLALGLEHLRPDGTLIMLHHRIESWEILMLLRTFDKFSTVSVFKPKTCHAKRSSFYAIAKNIQSQHPEAVGAVKRWKTMWRLATFGTVEEYTEAVRQDDKALEAALEDFGPRLIELGREVWDTQAKALAKLPFIKAR